MQVQLHHQNHRRSSGKQSMVNDESFKRNSVPPVQNHHYNYHLFPCLYSSKMIIDKIKMASIIKKSSLTDFVGGGDVGDFSRDDYIFRESDINQYIKRK